MFFDIISFQHVLHFDVGRSEIEWNMNLIIEILVFMAKSATKHHSNPYIESTVVLSDIRTMVEVENITVAFR